MGERLVAALCNSVFPGFNLGQPRVDMVRMIDTPLIGYWEGVGKSAETIASKFYFLMIQVYITKTS